MRELESLLEPVVATAGLVLEGVGTTRTGKRLVVEVTLDLPTQASGAVSLDQISAAVPAIAAVLDEAITGPYALEVTSPGTNRKLTTARHFKRARTRLVWITYVGGKSQLARVQDANDEVVTLDVDGALHQVPYADIDHGRIEVELNPPAPARP